MDLTTIVILSVFVALLVYTGLSRRLGYRAISPTPRDMAWKYNTVGVVAGVLAGHWYFVGDHRISHRVGSVLPFLAAFIVWDLIWIRWKDGERRWYRYPGLVFAVGVVLGSLFWGQA